MSQPLKPFKGDERCRTASEGFRKLSPPPEGSGRPILSRNFRCTIHIYRVPTCLFTKFQRSLRRRDNFTLKQKGIVQSSPTCCNLYPIVKMLSFVHIFVSALCINILIQKYRQKIHCRSELLLYIRWHSWLHRTTACPVKPRFLPFPITDSIKIFTNLLPF